MHLEIGIEGDAQIKRRLLRVGDRAVNARPAFEAIGEALLGISRQQFESEGRRSSGGWQPLAQSTIDRKGDSSILFDSGALMASFSERGGDNTFWATDDFLLFGSKLEYAGFHQRGTSRMPQRRPLELAEADRVGVAKILQSHILGDGDTWAIDAALGLV
jgi:phage gpG-like protein